jgi:hypothetical protein
VKTERSARSTMLFMVRSELMPFQKSSSIHLRIRGAEARYRGLGSAHLEWGGRRAYRSFPSTEISANAFTILADAAARQHCHVPSRSAVYAKADIGPFAIPARSDDPP